jgi:hypothetical protein
MFGRLTSRSCVPGWRIVNHTAWDPRAPSNCRDVRTRSILGLLARLVDVTKFATINVALCGNCQNCQYWPTTHADHLAYFLDRQRGRPEVVHDYRTSACPHRFDAGGAGGRRRRDGPWRSERCNNLQARRNPNRVTAGHAQAGCCPFSPIYSCRRCDLAHRPDGGVPTRPDMVRLQPALIGGPMPITKRARARTERCPPS